MYRFSGCTGSMYVPSFPFSFIFAILKTKKTNSKFVFHFSIFVIRKRKTITNKLSSFSYYKNENEKLYNKPFFVSLHLNEKGKATSAPLVFLFSFLIQGPYSVYLSLYVQTV